ncbi:MULTISPECIES: spore germination lipoprotein GerD [Shouchella]|uniref:Spore germination lipoprotein GerD n=2 Tax=Shouchella TaxID=2893057 RepID=A0ABY7W9Y4_9BACI|nr:MULTISPECIES: spore germination lipoprotein GerD [Shouchella]MED4128893.1 spore germination lipoprotein GerD [Shouchella miscanthi]WDF05508.1 spore germination lipoprotein GerD [Shouchella hunanensis]
MRMRNYTFAVIMSLSFILATLSGCAQTEAQQNTDYEGTKKMVIDLLKTDEGKKALHELIAQEDMREEIVMDSAFVKQTIQDTLTSDEGKKYWQEVMKDPEFAKAFAESMQAENEKIIKSLMKDPDYQQMMMDILKDPQMGEQALELMKSKEYREQIMGIMSEALESPYFAAKMAGLMNEAIEKQSKDSEDNSNE